MKFTVFHASLQSLILSFLHPISQTNKAHFLRFLAFVIKAHGLNGCPFLYWYKDTKVYVITHLSSVWFPLSHCVRYFCRGLRTFKVWPSFRGQPNPMSHSFHMGDTMITGLCSQLLQPTWKHCCVHLIQMSDANHTVKTKVYVPQPQSFPNFRHNKVAAIGHKNLKNWMYRKKLHGTLPCHYLSAHMSNAVIFHPCKLS